VVEDKKKTTAKKSLAKKSTTKKTTAKVAGAKKNAATKKIEKAPILVDIPRMKKIYTDEVVPVLKKEFGYKNPMQVPMIKKIVVNIGIGEALDSNSALNAANNDLMKITGQKPKQNRAKVSIANFKLREGSVIGTSVTLRGKRMWQFYDRLVNIALPRVRDFRGIKRSGFDGRGNYSLGMRDQSTFPEIDYNEIDKMRGLQIILVNSANSDEEGMRLFELLGMPFIKLED
tara:strand:- start:3705 stop:4394 length:690 start_codon:yes stop_codon:yes gene_type:complete